MELSRPSIFGPEGKGFSETMSIVSDLRESIGGRLSSSFAVARKKLFGTNNENLDFIMDSFYKLSPSQRNTFLGVAIGLIVSLVFATVFFYFSQVNALKDQLNDSFSAIAELRLLKSEETLETERFNELANTIARKTKGVIYKPFFERLSRQVSVPIRDIKERQVSMDPANPLSKRIQTSHIELTFSKISIPKLLEFMSEVEKSKSYMRVQNLKITGIYGTRLFFDAEVLIRGYKVN